MRMQRDSNRPPGQSVDVLGHRLYVEESGSGPTSVVFESGLGFGRTAWDPIVPLLRESASLLTYDRVGHGRSEAGRGPTSVDEMAAILCALIDSRVRGNLVLVAHSMGSLIARQAAPTLGARVDGMVLVDPTPETAAMFDDERQLTRQQDRAYRVFELVSHVPALRELIASLGTRSFREAFPAETYATIRAEDFKPSNFAQMRRETAARAAAVRAFRREPPAPPTCPVTLLSADPTGPDRGGYLADIQAHQRDYVDKLEDGRFELVNARHVIQADRPALVADRIQELLPIT